MRGEIQSLSAVIGCKDLLLNLRIKDGSPEAINELTGQDLDITLKKHREKRSLDANAYMWVLLDKLADKLRTSKEKLYSKYVHEYGVFTHILCRGKAIDAVSSLFRVVDNLGEVTVGKEKATQLQCYYGTSTYDSKQMSRLIDAIVEDCKEQGIETLTPDEQERMMKAWESR